MPGLPEKKTILIAVRTYPSPATKGVEVSCTGGITEDKQWIRLFPMPYRFLKPNQQFSKYQWIEAKVTKAAGDGRPESYHIDRDSIKIISEVLPTARGWLKRKEAVFPLKRHCLCCIKKEWEEKQSPTLGIFKPKSIDQLEIEPEDEPTWTKEQLQKLQQRDFFDDSPKEELEKIPFKFRYTFHCDHAECSGHSTICTDWEMGASYRKWRATYGNQWEMVFRERYELDMINKYDTHFYVGTIHGHPHIWIIVGLFYPPKEKAGSLL